MEDPDNVVDPVVLAERRARRAELAEEELRELLREAELGAATLKGRLAAVEGELATARAEREALAADLARRETELHAASRREHAEQALRTEAQTRAAEAQTGSRRELEDLRIRLVAAEQRAQLLTQLEAEVAERLERAKATEAELAGLRAELQHRQDEIAALREELERKAPDAAGPVIDPELAARIAAERTAFAEQLATVEHTVTGLRTRLGAAVDELVARLEAEQAARAEAETALADAQGQVAGLQDELAAATSRHQAVVEVVAELSAAVDDLRERFAAGLETRVAELSGAAEELRVELDAEQRLRSAAQAELERLQAEREAALAELAHERELRAGAQTALDEHRDETQVAREQLDAARAELEAARGEVERRQAELAAHQEQLDQRRQDVEAHQADRIALQAELAREQAQHAAAQSELGREQELRAAAEAELGHARERMEAAEAELEALRAAPPAPPAVDPAELERAAERLRAQAPPPEPEPEPEPVEPEPVVVAEPAPDRRSELADVLAAQQAAAAAPPDPYAHLPAFPVPAVVPFAAGDGSWLRDGIAQVGRADPALGAELLLALTPIQAHAVRREVSYQLTVKDAGTWRVQLGDMTSAIEPGGGEGKVAFRVSGTPGELAALFAGGGRRKLAGHHEGSRRALRRLVRARRLAPTLAQAVAAGGDFSLQAILALLGAVAPEGSRSVVAFDDGDSPITAVATRRGAVVLRSGIEHPQATLHAPEQDLVALLVGLAPASPVRVAGDVLQAAAFVTRLHRAQGLV